VSDELNQQIRFDLDRLRRLVHDSAHHLDSVRQRQPDMWDLNAVGGVLHSFYCGIENILKIIAKRVDEELPQGSAWHAELLNRMQRATDAREAVISVELGRDLRDYLGFRHVYRQHYPFELDWKRMEPLVNNMASTLKRFESEMQCFADREQRD